MAQCIHLRCRKQAWADADTARASYFCLPCAYLAIRGHLLFTPLQWEAFNSEGFIDSLVPESCGHGKRDLNALTEFPTEFVMAIDRRRFNQYRTREDDLYRCMNCNKVIISKRRHCGKCRVLKGLPLDEVPENELRRCPHWRPENGPGHYFLQNCEVWVEPDRMVTCFGHEMCGACRTTIMRVEPARRKEHGYDF